MVGWAVSEYTKKRLAQDIDDMRSRLHWIEMAAVNYRQEWGVWPGWGLSSRSELLNNRFNTECAKKGERHDHRLNPSDLVDFLVAGHYLGSPEQGGSKRFTRDPWGRPIFVRFLRVPERQQDGTVKVVECYYLWSYGPDGVNGVDATPDYTNLGAPDYDKEEAQRIEESLKDCGDDIVVTYP